MSASRGKRKHESDEEIEPERDHSTKRITPSFASHPRAQEWNYAKNYPLLPSDIPLNTHRKVWLCCGNCHHDYDIVVSKVTRKKTQPCPFCSTTKGRLCDNITCMTCHHRSHASNAISMYWSQHNTVTARQTLSGSNKQYLYTCPKCQCDTERRIYKTGPTYLGCTNCGVISYIVVDTVENKPFGKRIIKRHVIWNTASVRGELKCHQFTLLSSAYVGCKDDIELECPEGHRFVTTWDLFYHGKILNDKSKCEQCCPIANAPRSLQECQEWAHSRFGKCLSETFINVDTPMRWKCKDPTHPVFINDFYHVEKRTQWCIQCYNERRGDTTRLTIEHAHDVAAQNGGKCLSTVYETARLKLTWECNNGHTWDATYDSVSRVSWCPYCCAKRTEQLVRRIIEEIYQQSFPSVFADWNRNPETGATLELDGCCAILRLAFEYHGKQHYEYVEYFHRGDISNFHAQQHRDQYKDANCAANDVRLLVIPYWYDYRDPSALRNFICSELQDRGLLPVGFKWMRQTTLV